MHNHRVCPDDAARANRDVSEYLRTSTDDHPILEGWMALFGSEALSAESDAVVQRHVIADDSRFTDDDTHPVIDEESAAYPRPRVNLDSREESSHL